MSFFRFKKSLRYASTLINILLYLFEFNKQEDWVLCRVFYKAKGDNSNEYCPQDMYHDTTQDTTSLNLDTSRTHSTSCQPPPCVHHHPFTTAVATTLTNQTPPLPIRHHHQNHFGISPQQCNLPNLLQLPQDTTSNESTDQMTISSKNKCEDQYSLFYDMGLEDYVPCHNILQDMEFDDNENVNGIVFL